MVSLKFLMLIDTIGQDVGVIKQGNQKSILSMNNIDEALNFKDIHDLTIDLNLFDHNGGDPVSLFLLSSLLVNILINKKISIIIASLSKLIVNF